jgi:hypothetical protein
MKLCTAVQEGCGYKDTLYAHRYFAPLAKYFNVCITYQPAYVAYADDVLIFGQSVKVTEEFVTQFKDAP